MSTSARTAGQIDPQQVQEGGVGKSCGTGRWGSVWLGFLTSAAVSLTLIFVIAWAVSGPTPGVVVGALSGGTALLIALFKGGAGPAGD